MKLTILTQEVSLKASFFKKIRNVLRFVKYFIQGGIANTDILFFSGHTAVTKSLILGLRDIKADFVFNPVSEKNVTDTVVVLSDMKALAQAIQWKKEGKIKKLLAGPSLIDLPTIYNKALTEKEIDLIIVPSQVTVDIYEKLNPAFIGKIAIWYVGVDTKYWEPKNTPKQKEMLVYWKNTSPKSFCLAVEALIKSKGYTVNRVRYGHYNKSSFKKMLERSICSVFISVTETQGVALAEAWSMNVPTLVWEARQEHLFLRGVTTSAAPYLSEQTGTTWKELGDLEILLNDIENKKLDLSMFAPRTWVEGHMTDAISAKKLLEICESVNM